MTHKRSPKGTAGEGQKCHPWKTTTYI